MVFMDHVLIPRIGPRLYVGNRNFHNDLGTTSGRGLLQTIKGGYAFYLQYTNKVTSSSSGTVVFEENACKITIDGTTTTINCNSTTTIDELVSSINAINGISATVVVSANKTYGDLAPVLMAVSDNYPIRLIYTGTRAESNASYIDNPKTYIPYGLDTSWHSVELIADFENNVSYCAYDGFTIELPQANLTLEDSIVIGKDGSGINLRNLTIDYNSYGDAEIVEAKVLSTYTTTNQLISSHNPRLLIFEGHGFTTTSETSISHDSDNMSASVERLAILFEEAEAKGYVPVAWEDVIAWKAGQKYLPKRCFTMMFDDWRLDVFVNYNLRKNFVKFNVKPGLAVVTNSHPLTETMEINGVTYPVTLMVDMCMKAGWYLVSHTHTHRRLTEYSISETEDNTKTDVLEANKYGIYSNIIVYPYGAYDNKYTPVFENSGFALGVTVVENRYVCKASNPFRLPRIDIGSRTSLSDVLYPLV
jgi:peptidoglycan/xylan/chitin deacetylase (PgdA/CDA1 family)